ncbi:hypothetical protein G6F43_009191 [Rhizopus delemar]|nr:hypothetical protein G6F43_009191 [Rhizopus delemar]
MSSNNNIYTLATIHEALTPSSLEDVMQLAPCVIIKVDSGAWKECLTEINEACTYGWRILNSNKQKGDLTSEEAEVRNISLCFSQKYCCHRVGTYKSVAKDRPVQKKSKKVDCKPDKPCSWRLLDDIRTLRLPRDRLHEILQQPQNSSKTPRQIRIDMLKAADTFGRKSHRKVDKELYHSHKDHMEPFKIWMDQKLPEEVFNCFTGRLSYSQDSSSFACGFVSPDQQIRMKNSKAFCLDATHGISSNLSDILYILIIRDNSIGRGWPVAYMIINDRSTDPIVEWLQHLRNSGLLVDPKQFTIDCRQPEVNAITSILNSNRTKIQFCVFHVTQAWNKHLASVSVPEDKDQFLQMVTVFQLEYAHQSKLMDYFTRNWCIEDKMKVWSRSFKNRRNSRMLTNNYIESWHNQLKTAFLGRVRNKRLDKLVFVLVNDIEYYFSQEFERAVQGNGAMSPFFKQQKLHVLEAEEVDEEDRSDVATGPITLENSGNSRYMVCSFVEGASVNYSIEVTEDNLIMFCTCYDFEKRCQPCKHMYLLKLHTNFSLRFLSSTTPILPNTTVQDTSHNNSSETVSTSVVNRKKEIAKYCMDISSTLKYANSDLLRLSTYMTEEEATIMHEKYKHALQFVQQMKDKYQTHFRKSNTQL